MNLYPSIFFFREGILTKGPSEELKEISQLAHDTMGNIMKASIA